MSIPFLQVDAFTDRPFTGNPAAVCLSEEALSADLMQSIAAEMNLAETAFPVRLPAGDWSLRWFTPALEVDLCGHATLAAGHVLLDRGEAGPLRFSTRSGVLVVDREPDGQLRMDFPAVPTTPARPPKGLTEALGVEQRAEIEVRRGPAGQYYMVALPGPAMVAGLTPDFTALRHVDLDGRIGVAVTAPAAPQADHDFVSRFFAPWAGIDEDPVTGSSHCMLAPYWADRWDRMDLRARQISPRGGDVGLRVRGDRVHLLGQAVTVAEGVLLVG